MGFSPTTVSKMFKIGRTTLYRIMSRYNISSSSIYTDINDDDLDSLVSDIKQSHPHSGVSMVTGHLRSRGFHIQRYRIRECLRRIDPIAAHMRWGLAAHRRKYWVPGDYH